MAEQFRQRAIAEKVSINLIKNSTYIKDEEEYAPNYLEVGTRKISRVNIIGIIVDMENLNEKNSSLSIEDGTDQITVRGFEENVIPKELKVGDIVTVIGRPREYSNEKYILPEIIRVTDQRWMIVRKFEIGDTKIQEIKSQPEETITEEVISDTEEIINDSDKEIIGDRDKIIEFIKTNDNGKGIEVEEIINKCSTKNCDKIIEDMLKEGDLFENLPGKVKVLE